jgi:CRP-like cAMP-binding protein
MDELIKFLNKLYLLEPAVMEIFLAHWHPATFAKGELLTRADETDRYFYFMEEGIQKAYFEKEGKMHVIAFTIAPAFTCIPESFLTQKPSYYFLECITPGKMLRISYADFEKLTGQFPQIEKLLRKAYENVLTGIVFRYHQILAYSMEERFKAFVTRSPHLLNLIPHKDIASYLGMDPTNFSKLFNSIKI